MAKESAVKDDNNSFGLLVHDSTGLETRKLKSSLNAPNSLPTAPTPATGIASGRKVVAAAATAETLAASTACREVTITAELDNTGVVVLGGSAVIAALATRRGHPLNAGDSVTIPIDDLAKIYLDVTVSGDGVTYAYLT